jgi:outer membrane protein assembly factor BamB
LKLHLNFWAQPLAVCAALAVLLAACAGGDPTLREPRLTNPPRLAEWQGEEPEPVDDRTAGERKYDGAFRLPLAEDWSWEMPDVGTWAVSRLELATPAVHGDRVLTGTSRSPGVFVLDRSSGRVVAKVETQGPVQARPARIDDGWLVADSFGDLIRLNEDLEPVWDEPYATGGAVFRSPIVFEDTVLVATGADSVVAVGLEDGQWRWAYSRDVPRGSQDLAILGAPAPAVVGDEVVAGFSDGWVVGLQQGTGRQLWQAHVGEGKFPDIQAEVLDYEGELLIAAAFGGPVLALDAETHAVRWTSSESAATSSMTLAGGYLYTSDTQGRVRCLDPETGAVVWTYDVPEAQFSTPVRAGGSILVGDVTGTLHALDRFEGTEQWKFQPMDGTRPAGVAAAPVVEGRQILFPTAGGALWSLIAEPGAGEDDSEEPANRPDRVFGW